MKPSSNPKGLNTIHADDTLQAADFCLRTFSYKHLVVEENGEVCGVLSERDLRLGTRLQVRTRREFRVRDFMNEAVCVDVEASPPFTLQETLGPILRAPGKSIVFRQNARAVLVVTEFDLPKILQDLLSHPQKTIDKALESQFRSEGKSGK